MGTTIQVPHPRRKGAFISVNVPASAKPGQAMLVPVPSEAAVAAIDTPTPTKAGGGGWSTGGKVAAGTTAIVGLGGAAVAVPSLAHTLQNMALMPQLMQL